MNAQRFWKDDGFAVVVSLDPPKGADVAGLVTQAETLKGRIDAVLIDDATDAVMRMTPLAACAALAAKGMRPILGMNRRDRNRLAMQGDLLGAWSLGVRDVVFANGKDPSFGDHPLTKPIHDLGDAEMIEMAAALNEGKDIAGVELSGETAFSVGSTVEWLDEDAQIDSELAKMEFLATKGCNAFITSPQFDLDKARGICERASSFGAAVFVGVMLLKSVGMARYLNEVPGVSRVPEAVIETMASSPVKAQAGIAIAAEFINGLKGAAHGVCLMPVGWAHKVPAVLDRIGR